MNSDWSQLDLMTLAEVIATFDGVDTPMHVDIVTKLIPVLEYARRTGSLAGYRSNVDADTAGLLDFVVLLTESSLGDEEARKAQQQTPTEVLHQIMVATAETAESTVPARETQNLPDTAASDRVVRENLAAHERVVAARGTRAVGSAWGTSTSRTAVMGLGQAVRVTPAGTLPANMVAHPREELFSVLIVESRAKFRTAVAEQLGRMGAGTVHEAASAAEARAQALAAGPCDLAILDLGLEEGVGIDLVAELRAQGWPRIVVLASSDDPYAVRSAFQAGAQAYLLKSASPMVVTDGVRRVLDGDVHADPPVLAAGTRVPGTDNTPRELSAREVEVLQLVADGQSNKEIGEALNVSALTVKSHLSRIGRKLGTRDRAQMIALALRAGVIR
jgi:DNA-binding NarL/FixJ family response regulator